MLIKPTLPLSCILQNCVLRLFDKVITSKLHEQKNRNSYAQLKIDALKDGN